jgi:aminopeptidase YwaD
VGSVFASAVVGRGAAGALGTGSPGVSGDRPGYSLDQIGWASVRPEGDSGGFGFNLSLRQFTELRDLLERGERVVLRALVETRTVPGRMNVVSAAIPGTDPDAGELMLVAHLFERPATPGANDNSTGVAVTLEMGRTLAELIRRGELAPPKRTIRFLWVPEISGSRAYLYANPELEDRLLAAMNYDMAGSDLYKTDSYLRMKMTPDSRPSYLNDLIGDLMRFTDQTEIRTQTGNNGPFNYRMVPYIGASDHVVFLDAGIPAMQFNHWPDNFYHSSHDRGRVRRSHPDEAGGVHGGGVLLLPGGRRRRRRPWPWRGSPPPTATCGWLRWPGRAFASWAGEPGTFTSSIVPLPTRSTAPSAGERGAWPR